MRRPDLNAWMFCGALVGWIEGVAAYDPAISFSPWIDWITRLLLLPGLYALGAAASWLIVGWPLHAVGVARGWVRRDPATDAVRLAIAGFVALVAFMHLGEAVNRRFDAGVLSGPGIALSVGCLFMSVAAGAAAHLLTAAVARLAPGAAVLTAVGRARAGRLLVGAGLGVVLGGALFGHAASSSVRGWLGGGAGRDDRTIERVMVIGFDAADWKVLWPMMRRGELPHLARLVREGRADYMHTYGRPNSAMVWTSIATGVTEAKHGIHDFTRKLPGSYEVIPSLSFHRQRRAIWDIAGGMEKRVTIIDYPISYPPEEVEGIMVSRLHGTEGPVTGPAGALAELAAECLVAPPDSGYSTDFAAQASDLTERLERVRRLSLCVLDRHPADLTIIYTHTTDAVQHLFWKFAFPDQFSPDLWDLDEVRGSGLESFLADHWRAADSMLGEILERADERTLVLVVSDHGARARPRPFASLRVDRLLEATGWQELDPETRRPRADRTVAYDTGLSRFHEHVGVSINLVGREPGGVVAAADFEATLATLIECLRAVHLSGGLPLFRSVRDAREVRDQYAGRLGDTAMDVLCILEGKARRAPAGATLRLRRLASDPRETPALRLDGGEFEVPLDDFLLFDRTSGGHTARGVLIAHGPGVRSGPPPLDVPQTWTREFIAALGRIAGRPRIRAAPSPNTLDVTPTVLYALGLPVGRDMDGRPLLELFDRDYVERHPVRWIDTYEFASPQQAGEREFQVDERELEYLRALGYIN